MGAKVGHPVLSAASYLCGMPGNSIGERFKLTTFGESHGPALGGVLDGMPAGVQLDLDRIQAELQRRRPGQSKLTTARKENDTVTLLSGVFEGRTTGTPIGFSIPNSDAKSGFSNHGTCVDIHAPGSGITAAWVGSDSDTTTISGTSMACPHVAGVAAQIRALRPNFGPGQVTTSLLCFANPDTLSGHPSNTVNELLFNDHDDATATTTVALPEAVVEVWGGHINYFCKI